MLKYLMKNELMRRIEESSEEDITVILTEWEIFIQRLR
jgi:hypothetical protein